MGPLCVLHQISLRIEGHPTSLALEGRCLLRWPHVHPPVLHQLGLGAELRATCIALVLLSKTEHQLLIEQERGSLLFGGLFRPVNRPL